MSSVVQLNTKLQPLPITVAYGDGIGPEIMEAVLKILAEAKCPLNIDTIEVGQKFYEKGVTTGIPPQAWDSIRRTKVLLKAPITTPQGGGLGKRTMPEMLDYSVVSMITTLWLAARAAGLGLGWVSILDPLAAARSLEVPENWKLIAYLCIGWPEEEHADPELVRHGWQERTSLGREVMVR